MTYLSRENLPSRLRHEAHIVREEIMHDITNPGWLVDAANEAADEIERLRGEIAILEHVAHDDMSEDRYDSYWEDVWFMKYAGLLIFGMGLLGVAFYVCMYLLGVKPNFPPNYSNVALVIVIGGALALFQHFTRVHR